MNPKSDKLADIAKRRRRVQQAMRRCKAKLHPAIPDSRYPGVYLIVNLVTWKVYVGSASKTIRRRLTDHRKTLRAGTHRSRYLQRAWDKYGEKNFGYVLLERLAPDGCVPREQHWLDKLEAANKHFGYNLSLTAGSNLGCKYHISEESRENLRQAGRDSCKKMWEDPKRKAEILAERKRTGLYERIGKKRRGQKPSEETKAKVEEGKRLFWGDADRSAAARKNISEAAKAKFNDSGFRRRFFEGRAAAEEKRLTNLRKAMKNRKNPWEGNDALKDRQSRAVKEYYSQNPEARIRISESQRLRGVEDREGAIKTIREGFRRFLEGNRELSRGSKPCRDNALQLAEELGVKVQAVRREARRLRL